ncbi:hypothetical protein Q4E93_06195 [Flavitalea sp. BT771]|uniref:hypothetical protein n=1 Tax=Flavitalea sp. BT771 TaxID=3063329 RepID=UPI0026E41239|nr:hypothetical protein [Flavitalea sp. BT771]MDO6430166.1 hypothetical protein [Flavitalea sp. BT771]MDV6219695.1 hypothetical protein [Flavitalea sp. BT771]
MVLRLVVYLTYTVYLLGIEWAAAIIGQRNRRAAWQDAYKWLVVLCWATVVVETSDQFAIPLHIKAHSLYNIWAYCETGGIVYIQLRLLSRRWAKRLLTAMLIVLTLGSAANYIWGPPLNDLNPSFQLFTMFIQLITTCAALIDILVNTSDTPLSAQPAFWLSAGMLFYCSIFTLIYIAEIFFRSAALVGWYFMACSTVANAFMYGGFIACFVTLKRQTHAGENNVRDLPPVRHGV